MRLWHGSTDLLNERENDKGGDSVADERGDDENQGGEDNKDTIHGKIGDRFGDILGNGVQEARRRHRLAQRQTTGGEDDDGPEEVVKVFLGKNSGAEEESHGDDGNDAHVTKNPFELVRCTP